MTEQRPSTIVNHSVLQQSPDIEDTQLAVISVEVVRDSVSRDHASQWSGVEGKKQKT